jgi:hypothetical protein
MMDTATDETLDYLRIKRTPKPVPKPVNFFIDKKQKDKLPTVIDKIEEKQIDVKDFMDKIHAKIGIQVVDKITRISPVKPVNIPINEPPIQNLPIPDTFMDVIKTDELIRLLPFGAKARTNKPNKPKGDLPKVTSTTKADYNKKTKPKNKTVQDYELDTQEIIGDTRLDKRLPKPAANISIKADDYYLYNREIFINAVNQMFLPYKEQLLQEEIDIAAGKKVISCDESLTNEFSLLTHQKIVRDYINIYTPYRGLLLYHGLGSGKTCSSIAIAEGIKNDLKVLVMTPASLRNNYIEELKKCGDYLYKKNQYWEFIDTTESPDTVKSLSNVLKMPEETIKKNGGAWFINVKKKPNYESLDFQKQQQINDQVNIMIDYKYEFINYNGMRIQHLESISKNHTINPFSNKVIIIDEAHNFISRIVNKLKSPKSLSMQMYTYLMQAENCKIVMLTGTPIINYPNESAILFNILRGYIYTYSMKISKQKRGQNITQDYLVKLFKKNEIMTHIDNLEYNSTTKELTITKNPFGFVKTSKSDKLKIEFTRQNMYIEEFKNKLNNIIQSDGIELVGKGMTITPHKSLPDDFEEFKKMFIDNKNKMQNNDMFKMRIIGLTSYFRSAQEELMPKYDDDDLNILNIDMSDFQFAQYQEARLQERKVESNNKKKKAKNKQKADDIYGDGVSTYRIFSRAFCNFVFPEPDIRRPMPNDGDTIETVIDAVDDIENVNEDILDDTKPQQKVDSMDNRFEQEDLGNIKEQMDKAKDSTYQARIQTALFELEKNSDKYLSDSSLNTYSPKFSTMLKNIVDEANIGIHLVYSQFKTLEGIGIFKLVLKQNGLAEFKLTKDSDGEYTFNIKTEDSGKQMYASYSGDETPEEREIIKNVLNSNWKVVPAKIVTKLKALGADNNFRGEVIKVLMITSSGAEGISLKNVRFVHITEPYWHPVRNQQVIGRAKRICSHSNLPKELQTVEVFLYLMKFSDHQLEILSKDIKLNDVSKLDKNRVHTSDEYLYEISSIKENLNKALLDNVKKSAIDCSIHSRSSSKEKITCFTIGNATEDKLMYVPDIKKQENDKVMKLNKKTVKIELYKMKDLNYAIDKKTNKVYDYDAYQKNELIYLGDFVEVNGIKKIVFNQ